jgi:hypothetical protein
MPSCAAHTASIDQTHSQPQPPRMIRCHERLITTANRHLQHPKIDTAKRFLLILMNHYSIRVHITLTKHLQLIRRKLLRRNGAETYRCGPSQGPAPPRPPPPGGRGWTPSTDEQFSGSRHELILLAQGPVLRIRRLKA